MHLLIYVTLSLVFTVLMFFCNFSICTMMEHNISYTYMHNYVHEWCTYAHVYQTVIVHVLVLRVFVLEVSCRRLNCTMLIHVLCLFWTLAHCTTFYTWYVLNGNNMICLNFCCTRHCFNAYNIHVNFFHSDRNQAVVNRRWHHQPAVSSLSLTTPKTPPAEAHINGHFSGQQPSVMPAVDT